MSVEAHAIQRSSPCATEDQSAANKQTLRLFYAEFSMPGLHDIMHIHAVDQTSAERRAEELADEPWRDWPSRNLRGALKITVRAANLANKTSVAAEAFVKERLKEASSVLCDPRSTPSQRALAGRILADKCAP